MRLIFCLAALLPMQILSGAARSEAIDHVVTANFVNDGGLASSWTFSDPRLH